ncbi:MAG: hypothetical protein IKQ83_06710 [Lachnospiraceae bacterium]|nr:hypothetical protein [Lachnospiraceae bacterium]
MTLLITVFAAVISTFIWYKKDDRKEYNRGFLCLMFWGASLMWTVDAVFEYAELGAEYFTPAFEDMINDAYLGISVVALGLIIWTVSVLIKDPKGVIRGALTQSR